MVELMKFTRDICRLLGIGGDVADEQEEMECGAHGQRGEDDVCIPQVVLLSTEEGLSEEERNKRRAERRRAKRKRQKERKKQQKEDKRESAEPHKDDEEEGGAGSEAESNEEEEEEEEDEEEEEEVVIPPKNKATPPLATSGNKSNHQPHGRTSEEEPEWDVSSAFVANAASHMRPKGRTRASRENKENEASTSQVESTDPIKRRGASLTERGIRLFKQGEYSQAVDMFTEAIHCDPKDHRFFGNRSYCYWCLESYPAGLADALKSIQLAPDWPKGYFRKGSALMGLKRYGEAEKAMEQVLKLDKDCEEASGELFNCRVLQLMDQGFDEVQSILLLEKFTTLQAALASPEAAKLVDLTSQQDQSGSPCPSLWVGNVTLDVTEKHIWDLFKTCGEIESIRVLHERFCAFVNFKNANMAARALERLQGVELEGTRLVIRYPDRWMQRTPPSPQRTNLCLNSSGTPYASTGRAPINGDECFFWRTTGCFYGDKCRFKHNPDQRGRDKKPWQP